MVGGEAALFGRVRPLFDLMGKNIFHLGAVGAGQTAKLCQNLILVSTLSGVMEAIALGRAVGVEPQRLVDVMDTCLAPTRVMDVLVKPKLDGRVPFDGVDILLQIEKDAKQILPTITPQMVVDMLDNRLDVTVGAVSASLPMIKEGKIRALAVSSQTRLPGLPTVPTLTEAGVADFGDLT